PEFQSVIALKLTPVNAQAIHECAVLAALVDDPEGAILRHDLGMVARDARISDDQVFIDLPPNTKRTMDERNRALFAALHQDERGRHAGARFTPRTRDRSNCQGRWRFVNRRIIYESLSGKQQVLFVRNRKPRR